MLTGLHNRRALESRLADEIRRAQRYERKFSLVFGDVDHFKVINDTFGHAAGDAVLKQLATIFRLDARATDMVCRYGGEEFVLLLAETTPQEALTITERIRLHVQASSFAFGQQSLPAISMSFGISSYPSDAVAGIDLIVKADAALYEAKGDGRNCVRLARPAAT